MNTPKFSLLFKNKVELLLANQSSKLTEKSFLASKVEKA
jgi:hypothetical protein